MKIHYQATVHSDCKEIDGLPMQIAVGSKVTCKICDVQPLCENSTQAEKDWYKEQIERNTVDGSNIQR